MISLITVMIRYRRVSVSLSSLLIQKNRKVVPFALLLCFSISIASSFFLLSHSMLIARCLSLHSPTPDSSSLLHYLLQPHYTLIPHSFAFLHCSSQLADNSIHLTYATNFFTCNQDTHKTHIHIQTHLES